MRSSENKFLEWATSMWHANCVERSDWRQDILSFEEYVEKNLEWLRDKYKEDSFKRNQARDAWIQTIRENGNW